MGERHFDPHMLAGAYTGNPSRREVPMTEEEFDSSMTLRSFRREDATRAEAEAARCTTVGVALWGRTADDLQRQLIAPHPEIPAGCDLADLRMLQSHVQRISAALTNPRNTWLSSFALASLNILVGAQRFTAWEARSEIVRRAIDYLENHR